MASCLTARENDFQIWLIIIFYQTNAIVPFFLNFAQSLYTERCSWSSGKMLPFTPDVSCSNRCVCANFFTSHVASKQCILSATFFPKFFYVAKGSTFFCTKLDDEKPKGSSVKKPSFGTLRLFFEFFGLVELMRFLNS